MKKSNTIVLYLGMKSVFVIFIGLILFSCSEESSKSKNQLKPEGSIKESPINTIENYTILSGKYYCLKFNIIDELLFTKTKPAVENDKNLFRFNFKKNGQVEFKNLIKFIGCGNGMLAMDSVLFYPSVDSTFMFEFVGKIYAYNKFHVRNTYKIKQIDSNNFKLINLTTEERLKRDSINHTDSYGIRQGKWITSHHHENNYVNGKLHGQQLEFYSNGDIRYKDNYTNGIKEGYSFSYYKGKREPFTVNYYENENNLWMGFVEANKQYIYPLKDFHINADSIYVIAPYNNGNTWYEGAFLNPEQKEITGKRVGIHKVFFINGRLKAILDFDKMRITEYDTIGNILRDNDTFEKGTIFPTNYKK